MAPDAFLVEVDSERSRHAEQVVVLENLLRVAVGVVIPETPRPHPNALAPLLANHNLDHELVALEVELCTHACNRRLALEPVEAQLSAPAARGSTQTATRVKVASEQAQRGAAPRSAHRGRAVRGPGGTSAHLSAVS